MSKEPNTCIFCGRVGGSDEHVFASWIADVLPGEGQFKSGGTRKREKQSNNLGLITRSVCAACNTGWMSRLEEAVRPLITPAILGHSVSWSTSEQQTIAWWAAKTACAADSSQPPRLIPTSDAHLVRTGKAPTDAMCVMTGALEYEPSTGVYHSAAANRHKIEGVLVGSDEPVVLYMFAITVGRLVLPVLGGSPSRMTPEVANFLPGITDQHVQRIWPTGPESVKWPTTKPSAGAQWWHVR